MFFSPDWWFFWIRGSDLELEGTWQWTNGQELNYTDWNEGRPFYDGDIFDCTAMTVNDRKHYDKKKWWTSHRCREMAGFMCELE